MKKKLVSLLAAATMMLAVPSVALAAETFNSPGGTTVTDTASGVAISVAGDVSSESGSGYISVDSATTQASNVPADVTPVASFVVDAVGDVEFTELTLTFNVGSEYAGATAYVYIQHNAGDTEVQQVTVASNGTIAITVDRLSVFSVVIDESTVNSASTGASGTADGTGASSTDSTGSGTDSSSSSTSLVTDTSATSPATDASLLPVVCMTVAAAAGAGASAVSLRKRLSE